MRRMMLFPLLACAALAVSACSAADSTAPPASAGAVAPPAAAPAITALERTAIDDQALRFGYEALDTVATAIDAAISLGAIKPGSPKAVALADGLEGTLQWFNTASSFQRAGEAKSAYAAWQQAQAGLANLRLALGKK